MRCACTASVPKPALSDVGIAMRTHTDTFVRGVQPCRVAYEDALPACVLAACRRPHVRTSTTGETPLGGLGMCRRSCTAVGTYLSSKAEARPRRIPGCRRARDAASPRQRPSSMRLFMARPPSVNPPCVRVCSACACVGGVARPRPVDGLLSPKRVTIACSTPDSPPWRRETRHAGDVPLVAVMADW